MVFTANAGVVRENTFITSNFRPVERRPEEKYYSKNGLTIMARLSTTS